MKTELGGSLADHERLRAQLRAMFDDIDDETLRDTLEGISTLPEAIATTVRSYLEDLAFAAALGTRIGDTQTRLARIEIRADKKRASITSVMEKADIRKIEQPDFTASLRAVPPSVVVGDESLIPTDYWRPQPPKLDKRGLLTTLNSGQHVPGASLGNGSVTLSVRTK